MSLEIINLLKQGIADTELLLSKYRVALAIFEDIPSVVELKPEPEWRPKKTGFDFADTLRDFFRSDKRVFREFFGPDFPSERSFYECLEQLRWADGIFCPHCGSKKPSYTVKYRGKNYKEIKAYRCSHRMCHLPFDVRTGTIMQGARISMHKWMLAAYTLAYEPSTTSVALAKKLKTTQKTAWYLKDKLTKGA